MSRKEKNCDICGGTYGVGNRCVECGTKRKRSAASTVFETILLSVLVILLSLCFLLTATLQLVFKGEKVAEKVRLANYPSMDISSFVESDKECYPFAQYFYDNFVQDPSITLEDAENMIDEYQFSGLFSDHIISVHKYLSGSSDIIPYLSSDAIMQHMNARESSVELKYDVTLSDADKAKLQSNLGAFDDYQTLWDTVEDSSILQTVLKIAYTPWALIGILVIMLLLMIRMIVIFRKTRWKSGKAVKVHALSMGIPTLLYLIGIGAALVYMIFASFAKCIITLSASIGTCGANAALLLLVPSVILFLIGCLCVKFAKPYPTPETYVKKNAASTDSTETPSNESDRFKPVTTEEGMEMASSEVSQKGIIQDDSTNMENHIHKICSSCQGELTPGAKFCKHCGAKTE